MTITRPAAGLRNLKCVAFGSYQLSLVRGRAALSMKDVGSFDLTDTDSSNYLYLVVKMAAASPSESPALVEVAEADTTPSGQGMIADEQWRAMKSFIDAIYEHRQPE